MNIDALDYDDIEKMPTVHQGQYDDLKHEDLSRGVRVWLSRVEDGVASIELLHADGWKVVRTLTRQR